MVSGTNFDASDVLDNLPHAVLVVSRSGQIAYANSVAEQLFHGSSRYLKSKGLWSIISSSEPVSFLLEQAFEHGAPVNQYHASIMPSRKREERIVDIYAAPMAETPHLSLLTFRERSVADRIDRQLGYRGAARSVSGLAAMLGHEIKNPLSGIRGAAQLLGSSVPESEKALAELITEETDRIVRIVDRMEVFSDQTPIEREPVNIHAVLGHVRQIACNGFASELEIIENYDPSLPEVSGSRDELVQVFLNLVKNAAEALDNRSGGTIMLASAYRSGIRLAASGSSHRKDLPLEFTVSDNGPGIPDEIRTHVFDPFVTTRQNGSGLGLSMVARIVERHGGIIECESSTVGTTFRILLPAWRGPEKGGSGNNG